MKPTIIAIVGSSGSGKTHLSTLLRSESNVFQILSHTTRPRRETEREGVDGYFVTKCYMVASDVLTHTKFGKYDYYALQAQVPPQGFCTYVIDEGGVRTLKSKYSNRYNIVTIYVRSCAETLVTRGICAMRIERDANREPLPDIFYDYIISNDGSMEEFENKIRETFNNIRAWQHQK